MDNSPIRFLDNDVLNNLLPEYVAKVRKKKWWEDLFNNLLRCYKGTYRYDLNFTRIFDSAYPAKKSDQLNYKLMGFDHILSCCEDYLEGQFNEEYSKNECSSEFEPSVDKDFIPFYNLFIELTGKFEPSQLSDYRFNRSPKLRDYYEYLKYVDPYLVKMKEDNSLRFQLKNNTFYKMKTKLDKIYTIKHLLDIDLFDLPESKEKREIIKEKCEEIKQLKKTKIPYRKLTDKDKEILIDALKNYYYIMNTVLNMGGDSVYSIDKHIKLIIKNIEKIKAL